MIPNTAALTRQLDAAVNHVLEAGLITEHLAGAPGFTDAQRQRLDMVTNALNRARQLFDRIAKQEISA